MEKFGTNLIKDTYWKNKAFRKATTDASYRTEVREDEKVPNRPLEQIENYLKRFTEITDRENLEIRERGMHAIEYVVEKRYIISPENISDVYIKNILLGNEAESLGYQRSDIKNEQVYSVVVSSLESKLSSSLDTYMIPAELRESLENMIITDQKSRMKQWLTYLTGEESVHIPVALRYWAFVEVLKQGDYDPIRTQYNERTDSTVANFPELDQQALALVFSEIERRRTGKPSTFTTENTERKAELEKLLQTENFGKLYAFTQEHVRSLKSPSERLAITEGEWRVFLQGSSVDDLTTSLESFNTKWCIAGSGYAESYLKSADVWVYFSNDAVGKNSIPRACIVDNKSTGVTEVRGIVFNENAKQHLDTYITPLVDEKLKTMPSGEKFADTMKDMKTLSELHLKCLQNKPLAKNDLLFLYEINRSIQSSGYQADPRIKESLNQRNRQKDIEMICDCLPESIATDVNDIIETTLVFCQDTGDKLSFIDFREEKNRQKLSQIIEFTKTFKETGSPARLDVAIEGGVVTFEIDPKTLESLRTYKSAIAAYTEADGTPVYIYDALEKIPWTIPRANTLAVHILNHGRTTPPEREKMVADMDRAGYRVLTFSELVALGISRPDLNKRDEVLNTYEEYTLLGVSRALLLCWLGVQRCLDAVGVRGGWDERGRFLFVRK